MWGFISFALGNISLEDVVTGLLNHRDKTYVVPEL